MDSRIKIDFKDKSKKETIVDVLLNMGYSEEETNELLKTSFASKINEKIRSVGYKGEDPDYDDYEKNQDIMTEAFDSYDENNPVLSDEEEEYLAEESYNNKR